MEKLYFSRLLTYFSYLFIDSFLLIILYFKYKAKYNCGENKDDGMQTSASLC